MELYGFVEGPLLWVVSLIFTVRVIFRLSFFIYETIKGAEKKNVRPGHLFYTLERFFSALSQ